MWLHFIEKTFIVLPRNIGCFKKCRFYFSDSFKFTAKLSGKCREFPYTVCSHTCTYFPANILSLTGTLVRTEESILTFHHHDKSIVYMKLSSGCCAFYGCGQMQNDMSPRIV